MTHTKKLTDHKIRVKDDDYGKCYITTNRYLGTFSQFTHQDNYGENIQYGILQRNTLLPVQDFREATARLSKHSTLQSLKN